MKRARTTEEMRFAAELEPCAKCGSHRLGELTLRGQDQAWWYSGDCPACGTARNFKFTTFGDPHDQHAPLFELAPGASELISPQEFSEVLVRASARISPTPQKLTPEEWADSSDAITQALTSVNELIKLVPAGADAIPGTSEPRLRRSELESERARIKSLLDAYVADKERNALATRGNKPAPVGILDRPTLIAHADWLRRGRTGTGQLVLQHHRLQGSKLGAAELTAARLVGVDFTGAALGYASFDEATLDHVVMTGADLDGATFTKATIADGNWTRARLALAKFAGAQITGTDFTKSDLERSSWQDASVVGAILDGVRFGNAILDRATFESCRFRDASFARIQRLPEPTSQGTRFVDCDLTGTDWTGRDLRQTTFVRCKLVDAHGKAQATDGVVVQDSGLSAVDFVAQLR